MLSMHKVEMFSTLPGRPFVFFIINNTFKILSDNSSNVLFFIRSSAFANTNLI